eukprot:s3038_g6.t1
MRALLVLLPDCSVAGPATLLPSLVRVAAFSAFCCLVFLPWSHVGSFPFPWPILSAVMTAPFSLRCVSATLTIATFSAFRQRDKDIRKIEPPSSASQPEWPKKATPHSLGNSSCCSPLASMPTCVPSLSCCLIARSLPPSSYPGLTLDRFSSLGRSFLLL